jgi:hypothetical protein
MLRSVLDATTTSHFGARMAGSVPSLVDDVRVLQDLSPETWLAGAIRIVASGGLYHQQTFL